jgi:hypothetical protein
MCLGALGGEAMCLGALGRERLVEGRGGRTSSPISAPYSSSSFMMGWWNLRVASHSGVMPNESRTDGLAPRSIRYNTVSMCPCSADRCSAVLQRRPTQPQISQYWATGLGWRVAPSRVEGSRA